MRNIVETARESGQFSTFVQAIQASGLEERLSEEGPFTVFAPNDDAFGNIPIEEFTELIDDKKRLSKVLFYHIVQDRLTAENLQKIEYLQTLEGGELEIVASEERLKVNDAQVIQADIECSNGIIHVVNAVLLPRRIATMAR
jgi:uncharacterized surface protein with fasciclin (FAS1) repeats